VQVDLMRRVAQILLAITCVLMLAAPWIAPFSYDRQFRDQPRSAPTRVHPLGTDAIGRDRLSRLLFGGRISLLLAPAAAAISVGMALAVALSATLAGGLWERAALVVIDLVLALPWIFLLLAVRALMPLNTSPATSAAILFALLGILGWAGPARVLLAAAKSEMRSAYALAARASGCDGWRLALAHVLPNLAPVASAQFWTTAPVFLLSEANLSLLGLGISEPMPSWGNLLRDLQNLPSLMHEPWVAAPLVLLVITLSCCHAAQPPLEDLR
jgi:ABC-type dipeptide/oligopeptide/nickel transport system permease subunit